MEDEKLDPSSNKGKKNLKSEYMYDPSRKVLSRYDCKYLGRLRKEKTMKIVQDVLEKVKQEKIRRGYLVEEEKVEELEIETETEEEVVEEEEEEESDIDSNVDEFFKARAERLDQEFLKQQRKEENNEPDSDQEEITLKNCNHLYRVTG